MKIDKSIPIPSIPRGNKYPFGEMEIGDSIESKNSAIESASRGYSFRHPEFRFLSRSTETGYRVWRIPNEDN